MTGNQKIIIIGGEGTATNIAESIIDSNLNYNSKLEFIGFANDNLDTKRVINSYPIVCKITDLNEFLHKNKDVKVIFALYKPLFMEQRTLLLENLKLNPYHFTSFIHPNCYVAPSAKIGFGNVVLSGTNIHSNSKIGNCNIINSQCTIEHDTIIGNSNFFAAGCSIGSSINIQNSCFFGLNSCLKEGLNIPNGSFFGMGSVVLKEPKTKSEIWYGNPAKFSGKNDY